MINILVSMFFLRTVVKQCCYVFLNKSALKTDFLRWFWLLGLSNVLVLLVPVGTKAKVDGTSISAVPVVQVPGIFE